MLEKSLSFLTVLKDNNYKEWFHENKPLYEEAKKEFEDFVGLLIKEIKLIDNEIGYPEPKDCIFRIFRDIRFSNDKTPYKTNFGAYIAKGGSKKSEFGGYYFHLEPGNSLLAGGIWLPQPDILKAIREEIYHNTDEFLAILTHKEFKKHLGSIDGDYMLKTAPKDYPKDWPHIELLKHKSYTVSKALSQELFTNGKLLDEVSTVFKAIMPLNKFFNRVIDDMRN
jgi:TIGR02453 family protein